MAIDFNKLKNDLCKAQSKINEITDHEDGGSCNFDTCVIYLGRKSQKTLKCLSDLGLCSKIRPISSKFWSGWWFINFDVIGQGNCRTRMVECGARFLSSLGWQTDVYYQMD